MKESARAAGLLSCHDCGKLSRADGFLRGATARCPRCDSKLHMRKENSLARSTALLVAAAVMYIPANVLPVSTVIYLGEGESDTILSGVKLLFQSGDIPVAALLFFASIMVPMLKMALLGWLLLSVRYRWLWRPKDRTVVYRVVEAIGRWSMLDIFVISILVALIKLEALATMEAGPGAVAFCAVVILTIFAAGAFDPRLMWDQQEEPS